MSNHSVYWIFLIVILILVMCVVKVMQEELFKRVELCFYSRFKKNYIGLDTKLNKYLIRFLFC
jgi:hypothetical protein